MRIMPRKKEEREDENPLFPTFHEVISTIATRDFRWLGANVSLIFRVEQ